VGDRKSVCNLYRKGNTDWTIIIIIILRGGKYDNESYKGGGGGEVDSTTQLPLTF